MIEDKAPQGEGNREVQKMMDKWTEMTRQGDICACAIVACTQMGKMAMEYSGIVGKEADIYLGMDKLKFSLLDSIMNRQLPVQQDTNLDASYHVYARTYAPHCFDFIGWLVDAEMHRIKEGAPAPLKVCFYGEPDASNLSAKQMFFGVMRPSLQLVKAVECPEAVAGKRSDYTTFKPIVEKVKAGQPIIELKASDESMAAIKKDYPGSYITITLREAGHFEHRNSNIPEWLKFCQYLKDQGENVIIVRDTAKADEPLEGWKTCPMASRDLDYRVALYRNAKCNIAAANGPATLHWFMPVPAINFTLLSDDDPYIPNTNKWWVDNHGIAEGEQFPWFLPTQKIFWVKDTYDNMVAAWEEMKDKINA